MKWTSRLLYAFKHQIQWKYDVRRLSQNQTGFIGYTFSNVENFWSIIWKHSIINCVYNQDIIFFEKSPVLLQMHPRSSSAGINSISCTFQHWYYVIQIQSVVQEVPFKGKIIIKCELQWAVGVVFCTMSGLSHCWAD